MIIDLTYACKMGCSHCMSDCKPEGENMSIQVVNYPPLRSLKRS